MKRTLFCMAFAGALSAPLAYASNVDFNVGINVSNRPQVAVPAPPHPFMYRPHLNRFTHRPWSSRSRPCSFNHRNWDFTRQ